ncbi:MAG: GTPase Era [Ignavibacteriae bacterium]|nr:GTPase Era [Ignavibacteriota bacterium]MCB9244774.1 GTPase Era [Ignavibacteriales bacterium]
MEKTKCGYVTIFGLPNAGKSTLMNVILGTDLSIVNKKAQTTRNKILGILTEDNYQMIFFDTPGVLDPKYELQKFMQSEIKSSLDEADVVLHTMDVTKFKESDYEKFMQEFGRMLEGKPVVTVLNKTDLAKQEDVLTAISVLSNKFGAKEIVPVSAINGYNLNELKKTAAELLPDSPFLYDEETLTDRPERFFVAEIIRQKILQLLHEEIPYSTFINIVEFKEREKGKDFISAEIIVEKESQKSIVIGRKGSMLKDIGQASRKSIEKFLGKQVFLELFVKVRKDWRKSENFLKDKFN